MSERKDYRIHTDVRFEPLELVDVPQLVRECREEWYNQTLCRVNDCVVRLGIIKGTFHWHRHDAEDEFFYVVDGSLVVELETRTVTLKPGQGLVVPKGVSHRTRAPDGAVLLMMEGAGVVPTGD